MTLISRVKLIERDCCVAYVRLIADVLIYHLCSLSCVLSIVYIVRIYSFFTPISLVNLYLLFITGAFKRKIRRRYNTFILLARREDREIPGQFKFLLYSRKHLYTGGEPFSESVLNNARNIVIVITIVGNNVFAEWWTERFHSQFRNGSSRNRSRTYHSIRGQRYGRILNDAMCTSS